MIFGANQGTLHEGFSGWLNIRLRTFESMPQQNITLLPGSALPVLQVPRSHSGDGTAALIFKSQVILIWSDHTAQVSWCCNGPKVLTFVYQNLKVRKLNHQSFCHTQIYISIAVCIKYACAFAFKHFLREMTC